MVYVLYVYTAKQFFNGKIEVRYILYTIATIGTYYIYIKNTETIKMKNKHNLRYDFLINVFGFAYREDIHVCFFFTSS